jgi:hypothetical protein
MRTDELVSSTATGLAAKPAGISHALRGGVSVVGLHPRVPEPGAQLVQRWEIMLNLLEGHRQPVPRQILQQLGGPGIGLTRATPDNTGNDGVMQEKVIGIRCELNQAIVIWDRSLR